MLVPSGHKMEALEAVDDPSQAYRFAILGDLESDPWELFQRLKDTIEVLGEED